MCASQGVLAGADAHATHAFHIDAGNLDRVLGAFGQQAGVMIAVDSALTQGIHSSGLDGSYAIAEGLSGCSHPRACRRCPKARATG